MRDRNDHTANLPSIAVPTLMIVGAEDAITPPKVAQAMQSAIPRSQLAVVPDAGHMAVMEQPEQVNRTIANFVPHG
jgi:pimeloyl-ACP methyl ester carboxylesterase